MVVIARHEEKQVKRVLLVPLLALLVAANAAAAVKPKVAPKMTSPQLMGVIVDQGLAGKTWHVDVDFADCSPGQSPIGGFKWKTYRTTMFACILDLAPDDVSDARQVTVIVYVTGPRSFRWVCPSYWHCNGKP